MKILLTNNAKKDLKFWQNNSQKNLSRIEKILREISTDSKSRKNSQTLIADLENCYSKKINGLHRLVYKVINKQLVILQCRYHVL